MLATDGAAKEQRRQTRQKTSVTGDKQSGGWISFTEALKKDCEEVLLARIRAGDLLSQANPGLPANHGIKHPLYLQAPSLNSCDWLGRAVEWGRGESGGVAGINKMSLPKGMYGFAVALPYKVYWTEDKEVSHNLKTEIDKVLKPSSYFHTPYPNCCITIHTPGEKYQI